MADLRACLPCVVALVVVASPVRAQDRAYPRVEFGGGVSGLAAVGEDGVVVLGGAGPWTTINLTRRIGAQIGAEILGGGEGSDTIGYYLTHLQLILRESPERQSRLVVSIGTGGTMMYRHRSETRITRLDGSVVVHPDFRSLMVRAPGLFSAGITRHQAISSRAAVALGVHTLVGRDAGLALRASVGLTFGGYR